MLLPPTQPLVSNETWDLVSLEITATFSFSSFFFVLIFDFDFCYALFLLNLLVGVGVGFLAPFEVFWSTAAYLEFYFCDNRISLKLFSLMFFQSTPLLFFSVEHIMFSNPRSRIFFLWEEDSIWCLTMCFGVAISLELRSFKDFWWPRLLVAELHPERLRWWRSSIVDASGWPRLLRYSKAFKSLLRNVASDPLTETYSYYELWCSISFSTSSLLEKISSSSKRLGRMTWVWRGFRFKWW